VFDINWSSSLISGKLGMLSLMLYVAVLQLRDESSSGEELKKVESDLNLVRDQLHEEFMQEDKLLVSIL